MPRIFPFEKTSNFRDLGGYATCFARSVRWGRLYRSGELTASTDADVALLESLRLRLVFDLRATGERAKRPSRSWGGETRRLHRDYRHSGADLTSIVADPNANLNALHEMMLAVYRGIAFDQADAFRMMLDALARGEVPLLFHCAGGKDRTGAFAALLLELLGVSREDIYADYLLSNDGIDNARARFLRHIGRDDLDPSIWDPMLLVERSYLDAMFEAVDARCGSTTQYFEWLGFSTDDRDAIRDYLLETA